MSLPAVDSFTGANNDPWSGNWSFSVGGGIIGAGNVGVGSNGAGFNMGRWTSDSFTANQYAQLVIVGGSGSAVGPGVHLDGSSNGYCISWYQPTGNAQIQIMTAGANAPVSGAASWAASAGDTIKLSISGTTLTAYKNGVLQDTVTDGTFTTGSAGMVAYLAGAIDDFLADNVGGGGGSTLGLKTLLGVGA